MDIVSRSDLLKVFLRPDEEWALSGDVPTTADKPSEPDGASA
ncbi:hypothetical protein OG427_00395 [Streptomyces sp. NBC_00133]